MALIELAGAAFGYAGRPVVSGVDLEVGAGRFLGIVGPNGAGKTTLFRGILGLLPPLAGSVARASGAAFGYVPQRESLDAGYPLSTREVVEMGAYGRLTGLRQLPRAEREEAAGLIEGVGLSAESAAPFSSLSGGQRQRALLARALLTRPDVLLLDEPTTGIDRRAQARILELLAGLHARGLSILLVSHRLALVREAVEEVLLVAGGRVERGPARDLLAPARLEALFGAGTGAE